MPWGTFNTTHLSTLAFALVLIVVIFNSLVHKRRKVQVLTLFVLALAVAGVVLSDTVTSENVIHNLPLSLWSMSAVLLPYAVLTRQRWCCNLLLLWPIESLFLLVFNYDKADMDMMTGEFLIYFFTHVFIFAIPLLLFWLRLVKRENKYIIRSLGLTAIVYTGVHFFNVASGTNYLYSVSPAGNETFAFFRTIFPFEYWYMYLIIPAFLIYLAWWYLPEILDHRRKTRRLRQKLDDIEEYYEEYEEEYIDEIIEEKYG